MRHVGIIGSQAMVEHSLSPKLYEYWLKELEIDGLMTIYPLDNSSLVEGILLLRAGGLFGMNVTAPYKESVFNLFGSSNDMTSKILKANNLLMFNSPKFIEGFNTDVYGLEESIRQYISLTGKDIVILGAGGSAKAAILAANNAGANNIHILNRSLDRATNVVNSLQHMLNSNLFAGQLEHWNEVAPSIELVINTTSANILENTSIKLELLRKHTLVCDIIYYPLKTDLLAKAESLGHYTINGLEMLMHQAVPSFEKFFDVRPSVTEGLRHYLNWTATYD